MDLSWLGRFDRFELIRRIIGHTVLITPAEREAIRWANGEDWLLEALVLYGRALRRQLAEQQDQVAILPTVDIANRCVVYQTQSTTFTLTSRQLLVERPDKPFDPARGRDIAIMWVLGEQARKLFAGYRAGVRPTALAVLEAVSILATIGLSDGNITDLANAAGDLIDIDKVWAGIFHLRFAEYLRGKATLWEAWLVRHPGETMPKWLATAAFTLERTMANTGAEEYLLSPA